MAKRMSSETLAIIAAIDAAKQDSKEIAAGVAAQLTTHTQHDDDRFATLTALVESIATDTKSLLASRSYIRGAWKAVVITAATVSGGITLAPIIMTYLRGH